MGFPSFASEFPNDNAAISGGAIWVGATLTGPATLEVQPFEPVPNESFVLFFDDDDGFVDGPVDIEAFGGSLQVTVHRMAQESEPELTLAVAPELTIVAGPELSLAPPAELTLGAEPRPALAELSATAPDPQPPTEEATVAPAFAHFEAALSAALMAQGASRSAALLPRLLRLESVPADGFSKNVLLTLQSRGYLDGHARYSQKFRELCGAWSAVLSGASSDFAACGTTTLDRFGAELLAALLAVPATRADELRRELRRAGIAAFGVLEAA